MKLRHALLVAVGACTFLMGSTQTRADLNFTVDPNATWLGYINVFDQAGAFQFGFAEGDLTTAAGNFAAGPANPLTLSPNTRLYDENVADPFWVDQGTFEANLVSEFNMYQETFDGDPNAFIGQKVNFAYEPLANDLPVGYDAVAFIKVLDGFSSWSTYQIVTAPLTPAGVQNLQLEVNNSGITGAGTPFVQAGFWVKGAYVSSADPVALTGAQVTIPEPSTFVLGLAGLMGLVTFVRRKR